MKKVFCENRRWIALLLAVLCACAALSVCAPIRAATRIGIVHADAGLNMRTGAGTGNSIITTLSNGRSVTVLDQTSVGGTVWYQISTYVDGESKTGWVSGDYLQVETSSEDFSAYLKAQGFPESYWQGLTELHVAYPNWKFIAVDTGVSWSAAVAGETVRGKNLTYYTNPSYYIDTGDVDSNGRQIGRDGSAWVSASSNIVQYYMDPRNFLSSPYIFQFASLSYDEGVCSEAGVASILKGTFMDSSHTFTSDGKTYTHAQAIMIAGKESGVNPYHLAARMRQEQGTTGSTLSAGLVKGYEGYYNYFNVGAYTTSSASASVNGAIYAKNVGWDDPFKAICGGAKVLGKGYINAGQDTIYFQKFDVLSEPRYSHQYMTNISVGETESSILRNAFSDVISMALTFRIPVYSGMPSSPCTKQGGGSTPQQPEQPEQPEQPQQPEQPEQPQQEEPEPPKPVDPPKPVEPTPAPTLASGVYVYKEGRVSGLEIGMSVGTFLSKVGVKNGKVTLKSAGGTNKTSGIMMTGDVMSVYDNDGKKTNSYTVVIWGDSSGDGKISAADMLKIQRHLFGTALLSGAFSTAADTSGDGKISAADMLKIQRHLFGTSQIGQSR